MVMPRVDDLTILVPIDISESDVPNLDVLEFLRPIEVVLLGYFPVPDQAEPAHIKAEYEEEAASRLENAAAGRANQVEVLVFTHDREATIDRVADQYGCDAVLTAGTVTDVDRILVPLRGDVNLDRIIPVVADLMYVCNASATIFHSVDEDSDSGYADVLFRGVVDRLIEEGIDRERIDHRLSDGGDLHVEIARVAREFDLVVFGETEPSLRERIIGDTLSRIIDEIEIPALIVRDVE